MSVKRIVDTAFWRDIEVLEQYTMEDKFFALYLQTNPQSTQLGIYRLPKKVIAFDTGLSTSQIDTLLNRFQMDYGVIAYDETTQEIALLRSLERSIIRGGKPVLALLEREFSTIQSLSIIEQTQHAMQRYWAISPRPFDEEIANLFIQEIQRRLPASTPSAEPQAVRFVATPQPEAPIADSPTTHATTEPTPSSELIPAPIDTSHESTAPTPSATDSAVTPYPMPIMDPVSGLFELPANTPPSEHLTDTDAEPTWDELGKEILSHARQHLSRQAELQEQLFAHYRHVIGDPTPSQSNQLMRLFAQFSPEQIRSAIDLACDARYPYRYLRTILANWRQPQAI